MAFTQKNRRFTVATPLASEALILRKMSGSEQLSRLFEFDIELHSDDLDIKHEDLLGENITVGIELPDSTIRYINGFVSRISMDGYHERHVVYRATLSPWLWFLTRTSDCRIFQEMAVPDIIKKVFKDHGFTDFEDRLTGSYRTWEYCVQYRETDFNFVSRLMEQEGIYYFFAHEDGKHNLVIADAPSAHKPTNGYEKIPFYPPENQDRRDRDHLKSWKASKQIQSGAYALTDYDFKAPKKSLSANSEVPREHSGSEFEMFDYPGEYTESSDGDQYVKARIQELQAQHEILHGDGNAAGLSAGSIFELSLFPREDQNRKYLIIGANYDISSSGLEGGRGDEKEYFHVQIQAIDAEQNFRAKRSTPKSEMHGVQTAVVVGPKGEEIHTDEYGRVKVQFHWDRYGEANENSSCWIRVAHVWAGKGWGGIYTPRIGQEVIVDFLEGDPDQPIITGRVYNKDNMPPYELPANKTQSGIKSRSSTGGDSTNFNEIRFEDKKGSEEVYIHAEKDQNNVVENNETTEVGQNRTENVGKNEKITIGNDREETVAKNETISIGENRTEDVGKDETINIASNRSLTVGADEMVSVGADQSTSIAANQTLEIDKNCSISVGQNRSTEIGQNDTLDVGKTLTIEAGDQITIKTGKASIVMKKDGSITISGKDINIKASGKIVAKASKDMILKGSKITQN